MKKLSFILAVLAMVLGGGTWAWAAPYVSINLGTAWVEDADYTDSGTYPDGYSYDDRGEFSFDAGFAMTAAFGFADESGFRGEIEIGYRQNDIDEATGTYAEYDPTGNLAYVEDYVDTFGVDVMTSSLMFNGYYDFMPSEAVSPFIGAGIGFANVESDLDYYGSDDDGVFAYQFAAGVGLALNPNMKVDVQYRYFATEDPDIYGLEYEYVTHNVLVGLRTSF